MNNKKWSRGDLFGIIGVVVTIAFVVIDKYTDTFVNVIWYVIGTILFFAIVVFIDTLKRIGKWLLENSKKVYISLGIVFLIFVLIFGLYWIIPHAQLMKSNIAVLNSNKNFIETTADLSTRYYTESVFSPDQSYLNVKHILTEENGNPEFVGHFSYAGNEKWFVYGRLEETGILTNTIATTKIMYPNQQLRFPFVGGISTWKSSQQR